MVNDALELINIVHILMLFLPHTSDEDHAGGVRYMVGSVKAGRY